MTTAFVLNGANPSYGLIGAALLALAVTAPTAWALAPGEDGVIVTVPVSGIGDTAQAVVVDPNGNIVLAGTNGGAASVLVRLTPSGGLDSSFGSGGIAINDLSVSRGDTLRALVRLDDGRYMGCGSFNSVATGFDFVVARFTDKGALDPTFNSVGYVVTPFAAVSALDQCNALAVQTDGMVVAAGVTTVAGHAHVALARYTTGGALDPNFGTGGLVDISAAASGGDSEARALVLQPDGKLLVAGYAVGSGTDDFLVMRLDSGGSPDDPGFGTGGITRTPIGTSEDIANAMVLQPDGRIVLAGSTYISGHRDFALARYTAAGILDSTFGSGSGLVTTPIGPSDDYAYALTLMPWGRLVAAGSARISTSTSGTDLAVVAYNADGSLDRFFGIDGKRMLNISTLDDISYGLASDIGGAHFWAVGTAAPSGTDQDFVAVEFGLPDTIFRHGFETATAP